MILIRYTQVALEQTIEFISETIASTNYNRQPRLNGEYNINNL